jgi:hypothetical protein
MRMKFAILIFILFACGGVLAQGQATTPTYNKALEKELVKMAEQDQKYRAEWQAKRLSCQRVSLQR